MHKSPCIPMAVGDWIIRLCGVGVKALDSPMQTTRAIELL